MDYHFNWKFDRGHQYLFRRDGLGGFTGPWFRLERGLLAAWGGLLSREGQGALVKSLLIESRVSPYRFGCGKTALCGDDALNGGSFSPGKILPMADFGGVAGDAKFSSFSSSFQEELAEQ